MRKYYGVAVQNQSFTFISLHQQRYCYAVGRIWEAVLVMLFMYQRGFFMIDAYPAK